MSQPTQLALSRLTGRPVAPNSAVAIPIEPQTPIKAAAPKTEVVQNVDLRRIVRPQAAVRWMLPQLSAITPTYIESVMRGAFAGGHLQMFELFDLMEDTWPRLSKNLNELKDAVIAMDWKLEPWCEEDEPPSKSAQEKCKLITTALWRMRPEPQADENGFEATIYDVMDAWAKGTSVIEVLWEMRQAGDLGDITAPRATSWVHPVNYAWSNDGRLGLRTEQITGGPSLTKGNPAYALSSNNLTGGRMELMEFPPDKFLIAIKKAKTGGALQTALLRSLCWWWCAANFSSDWLMNLAQLFGLPFRWANTANGAPESTVTAVCDMLENMGSAGWACFPEGTTLELKEPGSLGTQSPQADLLERADTNCDLLILGQTLTSQVGDTGGAFAAAKVHEGVKGEKIAACANFAASVINTQLIPAILRQNYGDDEECPEFCPEPEAIEDVKLNAERDAILLTAGMEMPKEWFHKRHNVPLPQNGEEVINKPEPVAPSVGVGQPMSNEDEEQPDEPEEEEVKAKNTKPPARTTQTNVNRLAKAFAEDLKPIRDRLERILAINDPDILRAKLVKFNSEIPALLSDINADPESARVLEDEMAAGLLQRIKR